MKTERSLEQLERPQSSRNRSSALSRRPARRLATCPRRLPPRDLIFNNGLGGFTPDGREYVITLERGQMTPAPWVNVLANPSFGTVVSESGSAYTWVENCHEFRLTPWNNDPVTDATGEAFYIRDEQTGQFWSPTPLPARGATPYVIRHGFGYSVFEHTRERHRLRIDGLCGDGRAGEVRRLKLRNVSGRPRRLSVTGYWEWVLGELRHKTLLHVQTEVDPKTGALLARNSYNTEFAERIVFRRRQRSDANLHGRSEGVPRPERDPLPSRGSQADTAFGQSRSGPGSVRRGAGHL